MDPGWITAAIALAGAVIASAAWAGRWTWRIARRIGHFLDDYGGQPARDGLPARPGLMARITSLEDSMAHLVAETRPNGGNSLRDLVGRTAQDVVDMRGRMELLEKQRAGRED